MSKNTQRQLTPRQRTAAENLERLWLAKKDALGLSQETAAAACGWTQGGFGHYLKGRIGMAPEAILRIAKVLEVDPLEIDPELTDLLPDPQLRQPVKPWITDAVTALITWAARATGRDPGAVLRAMAMEAVYRALAEHTSAVGETRPPADSFCPDAPEPPPALSDSDVDALQALIDRYRRRA